MFGLFARKRELIKTITNLRAEVKALEKQYSISTDADHNFYKSAHNMLEEAKARFLELQRENKNVTEQTKLLTQVTLLLKLLKKDEINEENIADHIVSFPNSLYK